MIQILVKRYQKALFKIDVTSCMIITKVVEDHGIDDKNDLKNLEIQKSIYSQMISNPDLAQDTSHLTRVRTPTSVSNMQMKRRKNYYNRLLAAGQFLL